MAALHEALARALAAPGRAMIPFRDPEGGDPERPLALHAYRAPAYRPGAPVVLVQHGMQRNGAEYREYWAEDADRFGLLVLAPTFGPEHWPTAEDYNNGAPRDAGGRLRPRGAWGFASLGRIVAALREAGVMAPTQRGHLFGHSAGGQFVHRLISTQRHDAFEAAIAANPGWYTLPTLDRPYPEGLGGLGLTRADLARLLAFPLVVLAGDRDTDTVGPSLPRQAEAMRQGPHRFARARHYLEFAAAEAARYGLPCAWQLRPVPGVGHDGAAMSRVAAHLWFGPGGMPPRSVIAAWAAGHGAAL
jgi:poly(3-hydroxybutyrate) depolymerase